MLRRPVCPSKPHQQLIHTDSRNDAHGEYPDWPKAAREMIAAQKPKIRADEDRPQRPRADA
jgi:hypothetical protein